MARFVSFAGRYSTPVEHVLRSAIVGGCAIALIFAGAAFPF